MCFAVLIALAAHAIASAPGAIDDALGSAIDFANEIPDVFGDARGRMIDSFRNDATKAA